MASQPKQRLLFVCIENSNRSQMAEAFARMHGREQIEAFSAGSRPSGVVNPRAIEAMHEKEYDLTQHRSKSLDEIPAGQYDVVVSMGCGDSCPNLPAKRREEWQLPDPRNMGVDEFRGVRDTIEKKVIELLKRL